jgi:hypothetical protein
MRSDLSRTFRIPYSCSLYVPVWIMCDETLFQFCFDWLDLGVLIPLFFRAVSTSLNLY